MCDHTLNKQVLDAVRVQAFDETHNVVAPEGFKILEFRNPEQYKNNPLRRRGDIVLLDIESFVSCVNNETENEKTSPVIYIDNSKIASFINYTSIHGDQELPGWCDYQASMDLIKTVEWNNWVRNLSGSSISQSEFVEFIEDNFKDIIQTTTPTGKTSPSAADMLTVASKFAMKTNVNFKQSFRNSDGETKLVYEEEKQSTSGDISVPDEFMIQIPVIQGAEVQTTYQMVVKLKVRAQGGSLSFICRVVRPDIPERDSIKAIKEELDKLFDNKYRIHLGSLEETTREKVTG